MHVAVPNLDLPRLLSQLSIAKPLHVIAPKEFRNQYLEAITYLVRKDLVVQLHMFLVLIDPTASGMRDDDTTTALSRRSSSNSSNLANNVSPPAILGDGIPSSSSPGMPERQRLRRFIHDKAPKEIVDLFERLAYSFCLLSSYSFVFLDWYLTWMASITLKRSCIGKAFQGSSLI